MAITLRYYSSRKARAEYRAPTFSDETNRGLLDPGPRLRSIEASSVDLKMNLISLQSERARCHDEIAVLAHLAQEHSETVRSQNMDPRMATSDCDGGN
jgi:hypothetical protein